KRSLAVPDERSGVAEIAAREPGERRFLLDQQAAELEDREVARVVADIDDEALRAGGGINMLSDVSGFYGGDLDVGDILREETESGPGDVVGRAAFSRRLAADPGGGQIESLIAAADAELEVAARADSQGAGHITEHGGVVGVRVVRPPFHDEVWHGG